MNNREMLRFLASCISWPPWIFFLTTTHRNTVETKFSLGQHASGTSLCYCIQAWPGKLQLLYFYFFLCGTKCSAFGWDFSNYKILRVWATDFFVVQLDRSTQVLTGTRCVGPRHGITNLFTVLPTFFSPLFNLSFFPVTTSYKPNYLSLFSPTCLQWPLHPACISGSGCAQPSSAW